MKGWLLPILLLFQTTYPVAAQIVLNQQNTYALNGHVSVLVEEMRPLSIAEIWRAYEQKKFMPIATPNNNIDSGFARHIYWLAIAVNNNAAATQNMEAGIDNGGIFGIAFYVVDDNGRLLTHYITGTNYDFSTRPIKSRHFFFPLHVSPNESAVIFFRIDMRGDELHLPLRLQQLGYNQSAEVHLPLFYAFYSGALVFVVLFGFIAFLGTKDKVYLFYALYVLSYCLSFLGSGNFDVIWLYPHLPALATLSPTIYGLSLCIFMLLFMNRFLQLKHMHPKLSVLSQVWVVLLLGTMVLLPIGYVWFTNIALRLLIFYCCFVAIVGALCLQMYCIIIRIRDKYQPAYLYGAASVFVVLVFVLYVIRVLNLIPDIVPAYVYLPVGLGMEILILAFALIYSYNFHKQKHEQLSLSFAEEQLNFSKQLIQLQEAEQKRIAQDLHDELGGNLAALKMNLQSLPLPNEDLTNNIIQLIDKASDNARHIAHNLMPPEFEETKLCALLTTFFSRLNGEGGIQFHFYTTGEEGHFTKQEDLMIYRIAMELTNNIIKHSAATEATLQFIYYDSYLEMMAEDNGKGFANSSSNGLGLSNVQSRVSFLHGKMNIDSSPHGTTIMIKVPYQQ